MMNMSRLNPAVIALTLACVGSGCDLSKVDPGGGASSRSVVSIRKDAAAEGSEALPGATETGASSGTATGPGTIAGRIVFKGNVPTLAPLQTKGTAKDPSVCAKDGDIPDESLVVGSGGGLKNVFVYIDKKPKGAPDDAPATGVYDQKSCIFTSHAYIALAGMEFEVRNSDAVAHNVHTFPAVQTGVNFGMEPNSTTRMKVEKPEPAPFQVKCDIHPWMVGWVLSLDHGYAAITDADGNFEIPNVPSGSYRVRIWHERGKPQQQLERVSVDVKAGETVRIDREFDAGTF